MLGLLPLPTAQAMDIQVFLFNVLSFPVLALIHSPYTVAFWLCVVVAIICISPLAGFLVLLGAAYARLSSYGRPPMPLTRYQGSLDVLLGRHYRASTMCKSLPANNNVSIVAFQNRFVIAYRKADHHFASPLARMIVATASLEELETWEEAWSYTTGEDDLREMLLFEFQGRLFLYFACLAPNKRGFTPRRMQWTATDDIRNWSEPATVGRVSEITWDVKVCQDSGEPVAYKASYVGNHYAADAQLEVHFERSSDAVTWRPVGDRENSIVYVGGVSEVSFAFTASGDLVAIGRNEDGDVSGFGSQFFFARREDLGSWTCMRLSVPYRFDSPRMLQLDGELVLFARYAKESYQAVPTWLPFGLQRFGNIILYSLLPKSAAVYRIQHPNEAGTWDKCPAELIRFFEQTFGDTGFFSVAKDVVTGGLIVANYSSHCHSHAPWLWSQMFATDVYVSRCKLLWVDGRAT